MYKPRKNLNGMQEGREGTGELVKYVQRAKTRRGVAQIRLMQHCFTAHQRTTELGLLFRQHVDDMLRVLGEGGEGIAQQAHNHGHKGGKEANRSLQIFLREAVAAGGDRGRDNDVNGLLQQSACTQCLERERKLEIV